MNNPVFQTWLPSGQGHFFGFHDLCPWSPDGRFILGLATDLLRRPPTGRDRAEVFIVDTSRPGSKQTLDETLAWNFPQAARQQWVGTSGARLLFNTLENGQPVSRLVDLETGQRLTFAMQVYCVHPGGRFALGINFARLHRLGAYGYPGIEDPTRNEPAPVRDGIHGIDLESGTIRLILSLADIAGFRAGPSATGSTHHYVTHLVFNPSGTRFCFLHRQWLPDGGIHTRLLTCDGNGRELCLLGEGFLSHFAWRDDEHILIWARINEGLARLRTGRLVSAGWAAPLVRIAKSVVRPFLPRSALRANYLLLRDRTNERRVIGDGILTEDGHPMFSPADPDLLLTDTYPDKQGIKTLILFNLKTGGRRDLVRLGHSAHTVDTREGQDALSGLEPWVRAKFGAEHYLFTRSALSCDFHPRWDRTGTRVCFDSIHEGYRRTYELAPLP